MAEDLDKTIVESLEQEDPNLLRAACLMAGQRRLGAAERGLLKALTHKAWQIQAEAAKALGLIGSQGSLPYLRRLLKAADADLRQKVLAAAAAPATVKAEAEGKEDTHPEVKRAAALSISRLDPKAVEEALLAALASDNPSLLGAAMAGLSTLESPAGRERMVEMMSHAEAGVRKAAATALGKVREAKAVQGLVALLRDPDAEVRKEALIALNHIKDRRALASMADCLADADPEVRRVTAIALGNTRRRQPELVQALLKGLGDREAAVRQACLSALGNLKAIEALEEAAALMRDSHEAVARQAAVTVVALGQAKERPDYDS